MSWLVLSLGSALCLALTDGCLKKYFSDRGWGEMALARSGYTLLAVLAVLLIIGWQPIPARAWWPILISLPLEVGAAVLYNQAIYLSPLSLTIPLMGLTPALMTVTGLLILGETPSPLGGLGIGLVAVGVYALNLNTLSIGGWTAPLKALLREPGSWRMAVVACIYSVTAVLGKMVILVIGPTRFALVWFLVLMACFIPVIVIMSRPNLKAALGRPAPGLFVGLAMAGMLLFHAWAMTDAPAAYVLAAKRTNILFGVVIGLIFFKEGLAGQRILAAGLILAGVVVLGLS